jgi:hypothetical protein
MSFMDNLENNLKALESREQGGLDERGRREAERERAKAAAPWADQLKKAPWTQTLMQKATRAGHQRRIKVNLLWIGTTFRLEALGHRMELRPEPGGINAVFLQGPQELEQQEVDLAGDPENLIHEWMQILDEQKKMDAEAASKARADELAAELAEEVESSKT